MASTSPGRGLRRAWGNRVLRLELAAYALAAASMGVSIVVVSVALFRRSGDTSWATLGVVSRVGPFVALSAFSGAWAGRRDPRTVLPLAFAAQVVVAGLLAVSISSAPLALVVALGFLGNALWTVSYPSFASLLPRVSSGDDLVAANGLLSTVESLAWIAGPGLGGVVVTAMGLRPAVAVQAALAGGGALLALVARRSAGAAPVAPVRRERVLTGITAGVRAVRESADVHHPLALMLVANLVYGALQVLMLVAAWDRLGMSEGGYGALCAGLGAGALAALVLVERAARTTRPGAVLAGSVLLSAVPVAMLAVATRPFVGVVLLGVSGCGLVLTEVMALAVLQRELPVERVAGVFGLLDSLTVGSMLVGSVVPAPLIAWLGLEWALVVVGAFVPLVAVLAVPVVVRRRSGIGLPSASTAGEVQVIAGGSGPVAAVHNFTINT